MRSNRAGGGILAPAIALAALVLACGHQRGGATPRAETIADVFSRPLAYPPLTMTNASD